MFYNACALEFADDSVLALALKQIQDERGQLKREKAAAESRVTQLEKDQAAAEGEHPSCGRTRPTQAAWAAGLHAWSAAKSSQPTPQRDSTSLLSCLPRGTNLWYGNLCLDTASEGGSPRFWVGSSTSTSSSCCSRYQKDNVHEALSQLRPYVGTDTQGRADDALSLGPSHSGNLCGLCLSDSTRPFLRRHGRKRSTGEKRCIHKTG